MSDVRAAAGRGLLTPCAACGDAMSRAAAACPRCGHPNARVARRGLLITLALLAVGVALVAMRLLR
ncbi:hypothetical protein [Cognatilysobacter segetis]|uniref:hypothetical protein n=1 Tax=Cognatilysobacter segetis TaxID=2492394 RepID=UPI001060EA59|nr:hypothetical protein [Lysobacter segetis]